MMRQLLTAKGFIRVRIQTDSTWYTFCAYKTNKFCRRTRYSVDLIFAGSENRNAIAKLIPETKTRGLPGNRLPMLVASQLK
jgi:hypothetical protein